MVFISRRSISNSRNINNLTFNDTFHDPHFSRAALDLNINVLQYPESFELESEPYYLRYSGGKDSNGIRILAGSAAIKYELGHKHTTVDARENGSSCSLNH